MMWQQGAQDLEWILEKLHIPFRAVEVKGTPEKLDPQGAGLVVAYSRHWLAVWLKGEVIWQGPEDRIDYREVLSILGHLTPCATVKAEDNGLAPNGTHLNPDLPEYLPRNLTYQRLEMNTA